MLLIVALVAAGLYVTIWCARMAGERAAAPSTLWRFEDNDFAYEIGAKLKNAGMISSDTVWTWWMDPPLPGFYDNITVSITQTPA